MLTSSQMVELLKRSEDGEGVMDILKSMGLDPFDETDWLKKYKLDAVTSAKDVQNVKKAEKEKEEKENATKNRT